MSIIGVITGDARGLVYYSSPKLKALSCPAWAS